MSIFGSILDRIFHHSAQAQTSAQPAGQASAQPGGGTASGQQSQSPATASTPTASAAQPRLQSVDVEATLAQLATKKPGGGGNWRTSIVDLLKLLDLDSSLEARKTLAGELDVHAGADGTAEQNIALQKAVMAKLAENGGKVPDSLRH
jgi:hypothetical protein